MSFERILSCGIAVFFTAGIFFKHLMIIDQSVIVVAVIVVFGLVCVVEREILSNLTV